jgi:signal transduction histidine kinase
MATNADCEGGPGVVVEQGGLSLAFLHKIVRHVPIVLLAVDASGTLLLSEGGGLASWQTAKPPREGQSMYDLLEDSPDLLEGFEKALAGQGHMCRTYIGDRVFELQFSAVSEQDNHVVRAFCLAQDITERAESDRQRVEQQLRSFEQERRMAADLRALIESLPIGVVVTREDRVLFLNLAAASCLRWSNAQDYLGRELGQFVAEASREKLRSQPDGKPELLHLGEMKITTGDRTTITAEVQSVGIEFDGFPARLLSIRDVTELRQMEQDLHQAQRLEAIGRLAAGIAHEINTPIQFIGDNAQFLSQGIADVLAYLALCEDSLRAPALEAQRASLEEQKERMDVSFVTVEAPNAARNIIEGVSRVAKIVSAMKGFAHPGGVEKNLIDLNHALDTTIVVATNEWKNVARVVTEFGDIPPVPCRLGEINQVFLNLLVNAAHAVEPNLKRSGEKGTITVRSYVEGAMAIVAISDDGTGIAPEIRTRVFDQFFTTKEVGRGTGQGLAIARRVVVEQHGGLVDFTSEIGKGTTFYVRLPLREQPTQPGDQPQPA